MAHYEIRHREGGPNFDCFPNSIYQMWEIDGEEEVSTHWGDAATMRHLAGKYRRALKATVEDKTGEVLEITTSKGME